MCASQGGHIGQASGNPDLRTATVTGLRPFTQYNCCVEAQYSDSRENARACAIATTAEGCKFTVYLISKTPLMLIEHFSL